MMTAEQLRASILQMALQGKLVEQRPEEGTGEELYQEIQAEKKQLARKGKIKKQKSLPEITEDEIPFDIPESWVWVRLGNVVDLIMGQSPKGDYVFEGDEGVEFHQGKIYFSDDYLLPSTQTTNAPTKIVDPNTVLLCVRAPVGTVNITPRTICIGRGLCGIKTLGSMMPYFLLNWLRALKDSFVKKATGTTFIAITGKVVEEELIPLPPLAEQKRIVAKIEELMPFIDQYAAASTKLNTLNASFPDQMKKSILQQAVMGKLVPQDPNDEPASVLLKKIAEEKKRLIKEGKIKKQKPLPEIREEEIPFDIPESWEWVRLENIAEFISDGDHQPPPKTTSGIPFLVISNVSSGHLDFSNTRYVSSEYFNALTEDRKAKVGDILFTVTGSYGIPVKVDTTRTFCFQRHIALIRPLMNADYLRLVLSSPLIKKQCDDMATGTAQKTVGLSVLRKFVFPLPPLNEQKKILRKIKEIKCML